MKNKFVVRVLVLLAAFVLMYGFVPESKVHAETEYVTIEDEEVLLGILEQEGQGGFAVILAGVSCAMTIGAAFIWLKSEKKRVVEEEE